MTYGKWRPIIWYRMINIKLYFSAWKRLRLLGILFVLKLYGQIGIFTKFFCISKRLFLKLLFLEEAHFNAYFNVNFQSCQKFVPQFPESSPALKNSRLRASLLLVFIFWGSNITRGMNKFLPDECFTNVCFNFFLLYYRIYCNFRLDVDVLERSWIMNQK